MADVMDDLITWLRAQLDAREAGRHDIHDEECSSLPDPIMGRRECDCGEPEFVLADVEAKRATIELYEAADGAGFVGHLLQNSLDTPLRLLALPFAGQPGYDERWRP